jgi:hypothetical protein
VKYADCGWKGGKRNEVQAIQNEEGIKVWKTITIKSGYQWSAR